MTGLTLLTAICLMASLVADRRKTLIGILLIAIFMERYYKHRNFTMREG
ncbi:hypothetical protein [Alkaliflexus imshenetskii]|nr:hypothetical protein [Alkaliflexus imshenetskii]